MKNGDGPEPDPEDVWLRFLTDDEHAIRASAPREPSARERALRPGRAPSAGTKAAPTAGNDMVGEPWQPEAPAVGPVWRDLDNRARIRRLGRAMATGVAITLALAGWSWLSTASDAPGTRPDGATVQRSEQAPPDLPATPSPGPGSAVPSPPRSTPPVD